LSGEQLLISGLFLRADLSEDYAVAIRLSVSLRYSVETAKHRPLSSNFLLRESRGGWAY